MLLGHSPLPRWVFSLSRLKRHFLTILAGKYASGIAKKLKAIELLGNIQTDLGYSTLNQRQALQNFLESG